MFLGGCMDGSKSRFKDCLQQSKMYYVSTDGDNSTLFDLLLGAVQGSIHVPILYALFMILLFDNKLMLALADDSYISRGNK
jgi:hypothetical protein